MDNGNQLNAVRANPEALDHVDEAKRSSLRKFVVGVAYAAPAIALFSLAGISASEASTYVSNLVSG